MVDIKKFGKVVKNYINYIMKLGFKDLLVNFIELIILVVIAALLLFPVDVVKELLFKIITAFTQVSNGVYKFYDIIFTVIEAAVCFCFFIYMFNKRYEDIDKIRRRKEDNKPNQEVEKTDFQKRNVADEEIELPKMVEKKKF